MVSKHISYDFDYVDQRKVERKLAFKTTENKEEKESFQLDQSNLKPDVAVFVPDASVNKDGLEMQKCLENPLHKLCKRRSCASQQ